MIRDDGMVTGRYAETTMEILADYQTLGMPMPEAIKRLMFTSATCFIYVEQADE